MFTDTKEGVLLTVSSYTSSLSDGSDMHTIGEVILPQLLRSKVPVPVAAATSTGNGTRTIPLPLTSILLAF
jgi:hypothetical protein